MTPLEKKVIYWDTSAIISALFEDKHSVTASQYANTDHVHFISTLAFAETHAVIARISNEKILADILIKASIETLESGLWRHLFISPAHNEIKRLAMNWPLRGADLWHLAAAKTLQRDIPELRVLTFDQTLYQAVAGEGMAL